MMPKRTHLHDSEEQFRQLVDLLPQIVFEMDQDGILVFTNRHGFDLLGYSRQDFERGLNALEMLVPEDRQRAAENFKRVLEGEDPGGNRYRLQTKNGDTIPAMIFSSRVMRNGQITGLRGIIADLTSIEAAENARQISETRFQNLFDQSPVATMIYSPDGRVLFSNRASRELWELTPEAAKIARQTYRILEDDQLVKASVMDYIRRGFAGEATRIPPFRYSVTVPDPEGGSHGEDVTRWLDCFIYPVRDSKGEIQEVVMLQNDITQQVELEEQLRQSQKMEAIGRLAGGIAHDFNNMLTAISGYVEMAFSSLGPGDPVSSDLNEVRKAADRAARLTQQLLAFSRKQIVSPGIIRPNDMIHGAKTMLARIIGEDIKLVFRPGHQLWNVRMDQGQMDQILMNLAVNARDAMPEGGVLTLQTGNVTLRRGQIPHQIDAHGDFVCLSVSDDGVGMDEETRSRIFEPFFSTKPAGIGTGLGLSTVYGIAKQNEGFLDVTSEIGVGSTFRVYLPSCSESEEESSGSSFPGAPTGSETILLVEDDASVRNLARRILETQGYRVLEASGGGEAYLLSQKHRGQIDLLLTDIVMPNMSGEELAEKLREERHSLKVLFMTGYAGNALQGFQVEKVDLIRKPFSVKALATQVREVLDRGQINEDAR